MAVFSSFNVVVNELYIRNNNLPLGNYNIKPQIQRKIGKSNVEEGMYIVELKAEFHNTPEDPFPIELIASVSGVFVIKDEEENKANEFLKKQGFQMVFPYLRSLVSSITATAMMPPILLPIVYADQFKDED